MPSIVKISPITDIYVFGNHCVGKTTAGYLTHGSAGHSTDRT